MAGDKRSYDRRMVDIGWLPGEDLITAGLADLRDGRRTPAALIVSIGAERLRSAGLSVPPIADTQTPFEHQLYEVLSEEDSDSAHGRYNALIRRLVAFERALEHARAG